MFLSFFSMSITPFLSTTALPVIEITDLVPRPFQIVVISIFVISILPTFPPEPEVHTSKNSSQVPEGEEVLIQLIAEMDFFLISTSLQISKEP